MGAPMTTVTSDLSRRFAAALAAQGLEVPAMPATAAEVMALCQQEATDAAKLSAVIHRDQTIASNVLRVANSVAYGGQVPCASLQQACSRLGMQQITEIATAVAVRGRLFATGSCSDLLGSLWKHSVLTGFFAKEIARLRRRNVEIAFLCGLLHDVGKAVLLNHVARDRATGSTLPVAELVAALDEHHVAAGTRLAREWKLPEQIVEAIEFHHDHTAAKRFQDLATTVAWADLLAHHVAPSVLATARSEDELRGHEGLVALNLYPDQVGQLLGMRDKALAVTEGLR